MKEALRQFVKVFVLLRDSFKKTPGATIVGIISIMILCMSTYMMVYQLPNWVHKVEEKIQTEMTTEHLDQLKQSLSTNTTNAPKITDLMKELLYELDADKVYIMQYHNGGYLLSGLPFLKMSQTFEVVRRGIPPTIKDLQNMPVSLYSIWNQYLCKAQVVMCDDIEQIAELDPATYYLMKQHGVKSCYLFRLEAFGRDKEIVPIGFVGIEFITKNKTLEIETSGYIQSIANSINVLLSY